MRNWVRDNRESFERDVLLDFCMASSQLVEQFQRFERTKTLSFPVLRTMVGEPMNKGMLWRMKDKAHHLFRNAGEYTPAGLLLDWTLGYIFHETLKLMEDAHQHQYYVPQLALFVGEEQPPAVASLLGELLDIQGQTSESMSREVKRLANLLAQSRKLFCLYFSGCRKHRPLARFLNDRNDLVRRTFGGEYGQLIAAVYGNEPERMYIEAAHSLLESAREQEARSAALAAFACNPENPAVLELGASLAL